MANRSLLFACTSIPGDTALTAGTSPPIGLSEWRYAIPLVPRILASADTRRCRSLIWPDEGDVALAGRFAAGLDRLERFLGRIEHPAIGPFRDAAVDFLRRRATLADVMVLECAEVFAMTDAPLAEQAARLLTDVLQIDAEIERTLATLNRQDPKSFWERVFKPSQESVEAPLRALGLGYWSETLYFEPGGDADSEDD